MATTARIGSNASMIKFGAHERDRGMATVTTQLSLEMCRWLGDIGSGQTRTIDVATGTVFWRTFEHPCHVARLASRV